MVRNRGGQASSGQSETESERSAVGAVQGGMRYALPPHACCAEINPAVPAPRVAGEVSVPRVAAKVPGLRAAAGCPGWRRLSWWALWRRKVRICGGGGIV